ncbi:MAG TPA: 16S rRNA (cytosine(1402)-N(4))-methyltransferase RsmH [Geminicoccaceae bacterium]|mgnify:CR=1 FL=1|nr:16S rRNA (cytosine(1402)-N(4))-methyltransferase RsmH [Geminicoccus sp.]HMU50205.1 16S rRNA (cytosine(1402)-N(4))-methyltransferase RsmH [Geminicoccaceae bacterium]
MWKAETGHLPVLMDEAVAALAIGGEGVYVDATFGGGGYSRAILRAGAGRAIGIDRDPQAVDRGRALAATEPRFTMIEGRFGDLEALLFGVGCRRVDGIVMDVGVSSFQLDQADRGFSFQKAGPLDMRMGRDGPTAAEMLAAVGEAELARLLRDLGDEPDARRIAAAIVRERQYSPLTRTDQLASLIARVKGGRRGRTDPATRAFQAIRMWVNDELGELGRALEAAELTLRHQGRLAVVSFHSGEDELVKRFVDDRGGRPTGGSRHLPPADAPDIRWAWAGRKMVRPGEAEIAANPRARSARLRAAVRLRDADDADDPAMADWRLAA